MYYAVARRTVVEDAESDVAPLPPEGITIELHSSLMRSPSSSELYYIRILARMCV